MPGYTVSTEVSADTPLVTTAETVVATLTGCSTSAAGKAIRLAAEYTITNGAGTTALTTRIRRDSLTGTVVHEVNAVQIETAAGSTEDHDIEADDSFSSDVFNQTYVLTVQQTAATANGTVLSGYLRADCE